jgi:hypothetical protein
MRSGACEIGTTFALSTSFTQTIHNTEKIALFVLDLRHLSS